MVDIMEWFDAVDVKTAKVCAPLPAGYGCRITRGQRGYWHAKTKNGSKPSMRYYTFSSLDDAYAFGIRWANRQLRSVAACNKRGDNP